MLRHNRPLVCVFIARTAAAVFLVSSRMLWMDNYVGDPLAAMSFVCAASYSVATLRERINIATRNQHHIVAISHATWEKLCEYERSV